jgi:beta-hydroxyacyl-[acyl carrier protein] dehydratase FabZ
MTSIAPEKEGMSLDIRQIMEFLPHRYPFLLVDRVVNLVPNTSIVAYKNLSYNEAFFQGHFPGLPVMPGVLIIEALAQAGGLMVLAGLDPEMAKKSIFLFSGIEGVRFRRPVNPGDRLDLHCELVRQKLRLWKMKGVAKVDGVVAAEGELTAAITLREGV